MGLTLLAYVAIPITYWDHCFTTIVHMINRLPTVRLPKFISPYVALYNNQLEYMALKVLDSHVFLHSSHTININFSSEAVNVYI